jgi:phosphate starvation-inducible PhoH-like protein
LYDSLEECFGKDNVEKMIEKGTIEIAPLAYMRGRTLDNAVIILDEAQNTTLPQMKMFLTRLGFNSKMIITGDVTQIDLLHNSQSGLIEASSILKNIRGIKFVEFEKNDVMRNPLVYKIIERYEKASN